jgi:hypothetical protein
MRIITNFKSASVVRLGAWVLSNFSRGDPLPSYEFVKPAIPLLGSIVVQGIL